MYFLLLIYFLAISYDYTTHSFNTSPIPCTLLSLLYSYSLCTKPFFKNIISFCFFFWATKFNLGHLCDYGCESVNCNMSNTCYYVAIPVKTRPQQGAAGSMSPSPIYIWMWMACLWQAFSRQMKLLCVHENNRHVMPHLIGPSPPHCTVFTFLLIFLPTCSPSLGRWVIWMSCWWLNTELLLILSTLNTHDISLGIDHCSLQQATFPRKP